jgi:hypothetical protein
MSAREAKREIEGLRKAGEKICQTPETAKAFLIKHGFITSKGKLAKRFRG